MQTHINKRSKYIKKQWNINRSNTCLKNVYALQAFYN